MLKLFIEKVLFWGMCKLLKPVIFIVFCCIAHDYDHYFPVPIRCDVLNMHHHVFAHGHEFVIAV